MSTELWFTLACAVVALLYGAITTKWLISQPTGNDRMREIAAAIQEGAGAYLNRQYGTIGIVGVVLLVSYFSPWAGNQRLDSRLVHFCPAWRVISA